ncbi:MAG: SPFH domain-containing protein [Clostridiales bacterium]|nr:SPFH domain-containing protein [Clostridiales bacterium]
MGLLKMAFGAAASTLADQVLEYFYCDSLEDGVLMRKGSKKTKSTNFASSNRGSENIISNGSVIAVNEGQFMVIVEDGKIVDFSDEPGAYKYDKSTEPSLFYGGFGKGLLASFKTFGKRFTFGGETAKDQRVYYINKKLITGNKFGSRAPIDYRDMEFNLSIRLACHGTYVYKIVDPVVFYTQLCANVESEYRVESIQTQFKSDLMSGLAPALQKLALQRIPYDMLLACGDQVTNAIKEVLYNEWEVKAGINVDRISLEVISPIEDENYKRLQQFQAARVYADPNMAQGAKTGAQVEWMQGMGEGAAKGSGSDPMSGAMGMMAMAMMNNMMGNNPVQPQNAASSVNSWKCSCGKDNTGKFCIECGKAKPDASGTQAGANTAWVCECGATNKGKFCSECGKAKPVVKKYVCDKCGWKPEDGQKPPKFCPECGDPFNDDDIV